MPAPKPYPGTPATASLPPARVLGGRTARPASAVPADPAVGPLYEGDVASAAQFRAGLPLTPHAGRAELLGGRVRLNDAPWSARRSALATALRLWARQYEVETPGVVRATENRIALGRHTELWADIALYLPAGGRCRPDDADPARLIGPPEVVACVREDEAREPYAARERIEAARTGGVTELIVASARGGLQWYRLDDAPDRPGRGGGCLRSAVLPGLWLPEAVLDPDPAGVDVAAAVREGCATLDHALFVNALCNPPARKPR